MNKLLKSASSNTKLGKGKTKITKGKWKGMPLYQLTLEERKTCPRSCAQWANCYGNNMYLAHRADVTDPAFYDTLAQELSDLDAKYPDGFVVRLHVLGDFPNKKYVTFWKRALTLWPSLRIFGYTHRWPGQDGIGEAIEALNSDRCWIRFSDRGGKMSANVSGEGIPCPEQTGKTQSCLTCGLCWSTDRAIKFEPH